MMIAASLCLAALLSFSPAKAPSQAPGMWHADFRTTSGDAQARTGSVTAPTGGEVILVRGYRGG